MTDATPHRATPFHWSEMDRTDFNSAPSCILELRARIEALEAGATCPHIVTSDEGTSYCGLAEQTARIGQPDVPADTSAFELSDDDPIPQRPTPAGSLVEQVARAISLDAWDDAGNWTAEARAAIRAVAEWLDTRGQHGCSLWLREEVERQLATQLRAARRPKPPSLAEEARAHLNQLINAIGREGALAMAEPICHALDALERLQQLEADQ